MSGLSVRSAESSRFDFLSLGALVHRLDPGIIPFRKARTLEVHVSGGEYNVAANLADCFGLRTANHAAIVEVAHGEGQFAVEAGVERELDPADLAGIGPL